jgi:hypothetical protein
MISPYFYPLLHPLLLIFLALYAPYRSYQALVVLDNVSILTWLQISAISGIVIGIEVVGYPLVPMYVDTKAACLMYCVFNGGTDWLYSRVIEPFLPYLFAAARRLSRRPVVPMG